jgi:hypothetical protein
VAIWTLTVYNSRTEFRICQENRRTASDHGFKSTPEVTSRSIEKFWRNNTHHQEGAYFRKRNRIRFPAKQTALLGRVSLVGLRSFLKKDELLPFHQIGRHEIVCFLASHNAEPWHLR